MSGSDENLTSRSQRAVAALLSHPTVAKAAESIGIAESTLRRWLGRPAFRAALRTAGRHAIEHAVGRLQEGSAEAAETLRKNLKAKKASDQNRAASILLDSAFRGADLLDLAERLEAVETVLKARKRR